MNTQVNTTTANNSTYKSVEIKANGSKWSFMQVSGKINYISVCKVTNNHFATLGKEFKSWEEVENHYNSREMQMAIFSAQTALEA